VAFAPRPVPAEATVVARCPSASETPTSSTIIRIFRLMLSAALSAIARR
jgi:hypothetical protein